MSVSGEQDELAQRMSALALRLQDEDDREATLRAIVNAAVNMIPGASWAGISLIQNKRITSRVPTHELVADLDNLQNQLGDGPCVSAIREQHTVRVPDLSESRQQFSRFAAHAVERGVRSMLSLRLFVRSEELGALNLYGAETHAFTTDSEILADLVSQHAAVALAGATREHHLGTALANRDILGQAKGILMQRDRLTGQQAFDLLVRTSQDTNLKVVDVAQWLVNQTETHAMTAGDRDTR